MALFVTYHGSRQPREYPGVPVATLGRQEGDGFAVADDTLATISATGLYWVKATTACSVQTGDSGLADASGGHAWAADAEQTFLLSEGDKIACDAAA